MDTLDQGSQATTARAKKRRRTIKEKRDIVEETLVSGASVASVARRHDVNANQVLSTRKTLGTVSLGRRSMCEQGRDCALARKTQLVPMSCLHFILGSFGRVGN